MKIRKLVRKKLKCSWTLVVNTYDTDKPHSPYGKVSLVDEQGVVVKCITLHYPADLKTAGEALLKAHERWKKS